ncbi:MAG: aminomethyltransferase family protein [Planctomycetota bacterium]|jgi:aminomethyltransferase
MPLESPFHQNYLQSNVQIVEFFSLALGWSFAPLEEEVRMVRERAGFVDFSFNTLLAATGKDAFNLLQKLFVNDLNRIGPGKIIYSSMVRESGNMVADVTAFRMEEDSFLLNIDMAESMEAPGWIRKHAKGLNVDIEETGLAFLAFQGPKSRELLQKVADIGDLSYYGFKKAPVGDIPATVARLGFTGELGYEIYIDPMHANDLWNTLMEIGKDDGVGPFGLGATTVMAIEKGFLYGDDFFKGASPLEVGLGWTVRFDKDDFIGKQALLKRKEEGLKKKLVAFEVEDSEIYPLTNDELLKGDRKAGNVTNACYGFTVDKSIGRGFVDVEYANEGEELEFIQYGKRRKVSVTLQKDWYDPEHKKVRS